MTAATVFEELVSTDPFRVRRVVKWAECDPAGVVFAPNFYVYALWAYDLFRERVLGDALAGVRAPLKAASLVHHSALEPGAALDMLVRPAGVRRTTFGVTVAGTSGKRPVFDAEATLVCTPLHEWRSVPVPAAARAILEGAPSAPLR